MLFISIDLIIKIATSLLQNKILLEMLWMDNESTSNIRVFQKYSNFYTLMVWFGCLMAYQPL